ncbi:acyltransferase family protein [Chryseobacterium oryctis]|uniref:Acyltransferase n=1 Tax=Chryseobacterium oryctis TaxID=2952618 RepID=A0ABT3HML3_9FLAO|nr:acyltransferase [Chryseobacterium oryctis]MCW3161007.1 acyltransferase [Chryseobacterium oryctis]
MKRIDFLDGFRGIAILLVILYHGYYIWFDHLPFGKKYADVLLFKYGNLGVQLFFLISGFVILMSLEKTNNYFKFLKNRWIRLFPSMFIVSFIIFFTASFFHERPLGIPPLKSLVPGLVFINSSILEAFTRIDFPILETSFWTIYLEVKFYIVFGLLFYVFGKYKAVLFNFLIYILALVLTFISAQYQIKLNPILGGLIDTFIQFGWFSAGAVMYLYFVEKNKKYLYYFVIMAVMSMLSVYDKATLGMVVYMVVLASLFGLTFLLPNLQKIIASKFLVFIGFISYPLYLIHENMLISLIIKINKNFPFIPDIALPIIATLFLVLISYIIAKVIEPPIQKFLKKRLNFK